MIDSCQLDKAIEEYNSSCSSEEFKLKLDLLGTSCGEFNAEYNRHIGSICPSLFNILAGENPHICKPFDAVAIGEFNSWHVVLPSWLQFDGIYLKIKVNAFASSRHIMEFLEEYAVDPIAYLCYAVAENLVKNSIEK